MDACIFSMMVYVFDRNQAEMIPQCIVVVLVSFFSE